MKAFLAIPLAVSLGLAVCTASCGVAPTHASAEGAKRFALRGQIVRLEDGGKVAVIQHEKIGGWMDAMTMGFPIGNPRDVQSLHAGDHVTATVFVREKNHDGTEFWIGEIHRVWGQ